MSTPNFDNGLVRIGRSSVVHLIAPPLGEHPACMPGARFERMEPVTFTDEATCGRCRSMIPGTDEHEDAQIQAQTARNVAAARRQAALFMTGHSS